MTPFWISDFGFWIELPLRSRHAVQSKIQNPKSKIAGAPWRA
jgi:hypothetical protein